MYGLMNGKGYGKTRGGRGLNMWNSFENVLSNFDSYFDSFYKELSVSSDIEKGEKEWTISIESPGMKKEDFDISVQNEYLSLEWERKGQKYKKAWGLDSVDEDNISAEYVDGILKIILPKSPESLEKEKIKKIEVK